jgi:hypothetical protein
MLLTLFYLKKKLKIGNMKIVRKNGRNIIRNKVHPKNWLKFGAFVNNFPYSFY